MEKKTKQKILLYILTALTAAVLLLLFSNTTSPLFPNNYGVDSAFNRFMGLMIRRGKTLYSEIWDNKGPVLFFIQAIGTLKGTHNADVTLTFLMQIAASLVTIFFLYRADRKVHPDSRSPLRLLFPLICAAAVLAYVLDSGNLSEEWSLPMIGCGLYLLVSYAARVKDQPLHPRRYAFLHGVCIALIAFIRINNAISLCAGLLAAAIYLIYRKKWQNLFENILFGFLGLLLVTLPVVLYFLSKHALGDMIYGVFTYNLKYAAVRSHKNFSGADLLVRYLPPAMSFLILFIHLLRRRQITLTDVMMLCILAANTVMLWNSNIFLHYFIIFVPVWMLTLILYADFWNIPELLAALAVLAFFIQQDISLVSGIKDARNAPDRFAYAAAIPENEKDPAMVLYATPAVYLNSGLIPCSRFAAYHFAHFPVDPAMKEEFLNDMRTRQPKWIVYLSGYEGIITEVKEMLDADYEKTADEYDIAYYRRK